MGTNLQIGRKVHGLFDGEEGLKTRILADEGHIRLKGLQVPAVAIYVEITRIAMGSGTKKIESHQLGWIKLTN